tara:strand:- start:190 stop:465 length:276 start_codon:yes stop_codon:yes gene_type:complete
MTQFDEVVENQRLLLEAEKWAETPKTVHIHRLSSMWYETEESKEDFENGNVTDTQYNSGLIVRQQNGKVIRTFGTRATGEKLIDLYTRGGE